MKLSQLRALIAVARTGAFHAAARELNLSQPALSRSIRELEQELGAPLLVRTSRGATLTPYGAIVVKRGRAVGRELERVQDEVRWLRGELGSRLIIGLTPAIAFLPMLAAAVSAFRESDPHVELQIVDLRPHQIREGLREGLLDIGVLHQIGETAAPTLSGRVLGHMPVMLAASGRRAATTTYAELSQEAWLTSDPVDDPAASLNQLARHYGGAPPQRVTRCSAIGLYFDLATRLDVVTHWAEPIQRRLQPAFDAGLMTRLKLEAPTPRLSILLTYEDEDLLSPASRNFVRHLSRLAEAEFGPSR